MQAKQTIKNFLFRGTSSVVAAQFVAVLVFSSLLAFQGSASAGQLTNRSLQFSDSAPSGGSITSGVGSGTRVAMKLSLTPSASAAVGGIVIDFCSNSALVGDSCTAPTGLNVNRATTAVNATMVGGCGATAFTTYTSDATNNRIIITRATANNITAACAIDIGDGIPVTGNGITNPSTLGTFYARIYTYATAAAAQGHTTASPTGYVDSGSLALTTVSVITVTARVQEILIFCASAASPTSSCGGLTTPAISLGHNSPKILDGSAVDTGVVYTQLSTNAASGATVRIHNSNGTCGGLSLDGGTTCGIPPAGSGAATAPGAALAIGSSGGAAFGLNVPTSGAVTSQAPYASAAGYYGMDTTTANANATTTYGSTVLAAAAPVNNVTNTWTFAATASNVTPAGLYAANIATIATGNF